MFVSSRARDGLKKWFVGHLSSLKVFSFYLFLFAASEPGGIDAERTAAGRRTVAGKAEAVGGRCRGTRLNAAFYMFVLPEYGGRK